MNVSITSPPETSQASEPTPATRGQIADTGSALRAIIFKEVRPNLPYALGIVGIIGLVAMIPSVTNMLRPVPLPPSRDNILSHPEFLALLYFLCPVIGFIMGAVQGRSSRTPDAWAFMYHRPVTTTNLFLGRLLGAAILYAVAAGIPMLGLLLYAGLSPTYPFDWRYDLPVFVAVAGGFLFCIAGLLIMERKAFILGSATMPLLSMALATVAAALVPSFSLAMLILLLAGAILAIATWGSHASDGFERRAPAAAQAALSLVLLIGFIVLLAVPSQVIKQPFRDASPSQPSSAFGIPLIMSVSGGASGRLSNSTTTIYVFLPDGTIGRRVEEYKPASTAGAVEYHERIFREDPASTELNVEELRKALDLISTSSFNLAPPPPAYTDVESKNDIVSGSFDDNEIWYFVRLAGLIRGYDRRTGTSLGTIGAEGFGSSVPFRRWNADLSIFAGPRGVYEVDARKRTSTLRLEVPAGETVEGWCLVRGGPGPANEPAGVFLAALTQTHIYLANNNSTRPAPSLALPIGTTTFGSGSFHIVGFAAAKRWGVIRSSDPAAKVLKGPTTFQIFDDTGKLVSEKSVPQPQFTDPPPSPTREEYQSATNPLGTYAAGFLDAISNPPAMAALSAIVSSGMFTDQPARRGWFFAPQLDTWYLAPAIEVLLVSALFAFLLGRVFAVRVRWVWVLLAFLGGPSIVLLMMATHRVQHATACPNCGKSRLLFTKKCPLCGAEFPPAPTNGSEIFTA